MTQSGKYKCLFPAVPHSGTFTESMDYILSLEFFRTTYTSVTIMSVVALMELTVL